MLSSCRKSSVQNSYLKSIERFNYCNQQNERVLFQFGNLNLSSANKANKHYLSQLSLCFITTNKSHRNPELNKIIFSFLTPTFLSWTSSDKKSLLRASISNFHFRSFALFKTLTVQPHPMSSLINPPFQLKPAKNLAKLLKFEKPINIKKLLAKR